MAMRRCSALALGVVVCSCALAWAGRSLTDGGVLVDEGTAGSFMLDYPALRDAAGKDFRVSDKTINGNKATLKYDRGGTADLSLDDRGVLAIAFRDIPADATSFGLGMKIDFAYQGGQWQIDSGDLKTFPREKPAGPYLFGGFAKTVRIISPGGARVTLTPPDGAYHQLQDNREWNYKCFYWLAWTPLDRNNPRYTLKIDDRGAVVVKPKVIVDRFGQDVSAPLPNRVHNEDELKKDVEEEKAYYANLRPPVRDRFGGLPGSKETLGLKQTGFFHVEKKGDRWHLVDPDGNDFFHLGICCFNMQTWTYVEGRESIYEWLPPKDGLFEDAWIWGPNLSFHAVNLIRKYGPYDLEQFQTRMIERARAWGFNSAGGFSGISSDHVAISKAHFPYVAHLPTENMSWLVNAIFDPFDQANRASFDKQCAAQLAPQANDPQLIGYFLSNEPYVEEIPRMLSTLKGNAVKVRLVQFLQEKYKTIDAFNEAWNTRQPDFKSTQNVALLVTTQPAADDMQQFTGIFFEEYYRFIADTVRKYDQNHMLIGNRFGTAFNDQALRNAGKYLDVISVNHYTYALDTRSLDRVNRICGDKPIILSEFYFDSPSDSGLPGGIRDVASQQERGLGYRSYVEQAASLKYIVGTEWFTLVDMPRTGAWYLKHNPGAECGNSGLLSVTDRPWKTALAEMMKTNYSIYEVTGGQRQRFVFNDPRFNASDTQAKRTLKIPRVPQGTIVVNGKRDGWPGLPAEPISGKRMVLGADPGDFEASFRACYDQDNLYLMVELIDSTPMNNTQKAEMLWSGDAVELFIGSEKPQQDGSLLLSDRQILLGAGNANGRDSLWVMRAARQPPYHMIVIPNVDGKGYLLEAAIPFTALGLKPETGKALLFDLAVDDSADGERRLRQLMWNGTSQNAYIRGAWGQAVLGE